MEATLKDGQGLLRKNLVESINRGGLVLLSEDLAAQTE